MIVDVNLHVSAPRLLEPTAPNPRYLKLGRGVSAPCRVKERRDCELRACVQAVNCSP